MKCVTYILFTDAPDGSKPVVNDSKDGEEKMDSDENPKPRALHKTASIFLRNLAPTITKQEVEQMCRRYNGFLRAAIADPQPERRWFRRGWVTFKRDVNIKDICWNLNNIRVISDSKLLFPLKNFNIIKYFIELLQSLPV